MFIVWIITNLKRLYDGGGRRMKNSYKTLWMKKSFFFSSVMYKQELQTVTEQQRSGSKVL